MSFPGAGDGGAPLEHVDQVFHPAGHGVVPVPGGPGGRDRRQHLVDGLDRLVDQVVDVLLPGHEQPDQPLGEGLLAQLVGDDAGGSAVGEGCEGGADPPGAGGADGAEAGGEQ